MKKSQTEKGEKLHLLLRSSCALTNGTPGKAWLFIDMCIRSTFKLNKMVPGRNPLGAQDHLGK